MSNSKILWAVEADVGKGYELLKSDASWTRQDARDWKYWNVSGLLDSRIRKYVPAEIQHN